MPKSLPLKEKQQIAFSHLVGTSKQNVAVYTDIIQDFGQIIYKNKGVSNAEYGVDSNDVAVLLVEINERTKYINKFTKIWVDKIPASKNQIAEYVISNDGVYCNGLMRYMISKQSQNNKKIWYEYNSVICYVNVEYDKENCVIQIPKTFYLPIDETTKVWTIEPTDNTSTKGLLRLLTIEDIGSYRKLHFEGIV